VQDPALALVEFHQVEFMNVAMILVHIIGKNNTKTIQMQTNQKAAKNRKKYRRTPLPSFESQQHNFAP